MKSSDGASSDTIAVAREIEFGACTRNRSSALVDIRADSLSTLVPQTEAGATSGRAMSASRAPSLKGWSGGSTTAAERTF